MATRETIRVAFYDELETAVDGLVNAGNISQQYPESEEQLPALVHTDAYRQVPMNNNTGVKEVINGTPVIYQYAVVKEAQFTVTVAAQSESVKEAIYEALETHFESYTLPLKDVSQLHDDVVNVRIDDVSSTDDDNSEPVTRQDELSIIVRYERIYELEEAQITAIQNGVTIDSVTETYTTT